MQFIRVGLSLWLTGFYSIKALHLNGSNPTLKGHEDIRYCMSELNHTIIKSITGSSLVRATYRHSELPDVAQDNPNNRGKHS